jgi:hypothetical protein
MYVPPLRRPSSEEQQRYHGVCCHLLLRCILPPVSAARLCRVRTSTSDPVASCQPRRPGSGMYLPDMSVVSKRHIPATLSGASAHNPSRGRDASDSGCCPSRPHIGQPVICSNACFHTKTRDLHLVSPPTARRLDLVEMVSGLFADAHRVAAELTGVDSCWQLELELCRSNISDLYRA